MPGIPRALQPLMTMIGRGLTVVLLSTLAACVASADADGASSDAEVAARASRTSPPIYMDLGMVTNGAETNFDIPANAIGFNIVLEDESTTAGASSTVALYELRNAAGEVVVAAGGVVGGHESTLFRPQSISYQVPSSDTALRTPLVGRWTAVLVAYDSAGMISRTARLRAKLVVQTTADGAFHGGLLDLHVYVPDDLKVQDPEPQHTVNATTAQKDACIKARIDGFYVAVQAMLGIDRGKVTFHRVAASYGEVVGDPELRSYFAESKVVANAPALHVMLTNAIALDPGSVDLAWGVAAAIGGAAGRVGTGLSGVALSISPTFPASADALTLLHETGHFMGLNHTSEMTGTSFDAFADTPQCLGVTNENFRSCPDGRDLMFALYYGASQGGVGVYLSPSQKRVVQGAPVYRPYARAPKP